MPSERVKPEPFAIVAPFAEQASDLVKHDCHSTLLSLCPQDWKFLGSKNRTNCSLQPQAEDNLGTNSSLELQLSAPTAQGPHNSTPPFFNPIIIQ